MKFSVTVVGAVCCVTETVSVVVWDNSIVPRQQQTVLYISIELKRAVSRGGFLLATCWQTAYLSTWMCQQNERAPDTAASAVCTVQLFVWLHKSQVRIFPEQETALKPDTRDEITCLHLLRANSAPPGSFPHARPPDEGEDSTNPSHSCYLRACNEISIATGHGREGRSSEKVSTWSI